MKTKIKKMMLTNKPTKQIFSLSYIKKKLLCGIFYETLKLVKHCAITFYTVLPIVFNTIDRLDQRLIFELFSSFRFPHFLQ